MDATITISLIAFALSFATLIVIRINRAEERETAYGDVPLIPEELKGARDRFAGGGAPSKADALRNTGHSIARHDSGAL